MSDGDEGVCVAVCIAVCVAAVCVAVCVAVYPHIYTLSTSATAAFWTAYMYIHTYTYGVVTLQVSFEIILQLWLVGSIILQVSFENYRPFYKALLQKRPIILSILLTKATPIWILCRILPTYLGGQNGRDSSARFYICIVKRDPYSWKETRILEKRPIFMTRDLYPFIGGPKGRTAAHSCKCISSKESSIPEASLIFLKRDLYFRWETYIHTSFVHIQAVKTAELAAHNSIRSSPKETYILEKRLIFMKRDLYS